MTCEPIIPRAIILVVYDRFRCSTISMRLLVVLTDFVDAVTGATWLRPFRRAARRHLVLFVALPTISGADRAGPAGQRRGGFSQGRGDWPAPRTRKVLEGLRRTGVFVVDVNPQELTPNLLNKYLEISFRGLL